MLDGEHRSVVEVGISYIADEGRPRHRCASRNQDTVVRLLKLAA
jgi:hypothetical protein